MKINIEDVLSFFSEDLHLQIIDDTAYVVDYGDLSDWAVYNSFTLEDIKAKNVNLDSLVQDFLVVSERQFLLEEDLPNRFKVDKETLDKLEVQKFCTWSDILKELGFKKASDYLKPYCDFAKDCKNITTLSGDRINQIRHESEEDLVSKGRFYTALNSLTPECIVKNNLVILKDIEWDALDELEEYIDDLDNASRQRLAMCSIEGLSADEVDDIIHQNVVDEKIDLDLVCDVFDLPRIVPISRTLIDENLELPDCVLDKEEAYTYIGFQKEIINDVIGNYITDKYGWLHMGYMEGGLSPLIEKTLKDNKLIEDDKGVYKNKANKNKSVDR